jgi:hypothetical protein
MFWGAFMLGCGVSDVRVCKRRKRKDLLMSWKSEFEKGKDED